MSQRNSVSVFLFFLLLALPLSHFSQDNSPSDAKVLQAAIDRAPTSAEIMRERISKAKAMLAVRNHGAAIYELESIKRENTEPAVDRVVNVLLMSAYLELSDYPKAKELLKEVQESQGSEASFDYLAVAGQVVHGARTQVDRYKSLGLSINDRNLPTVASADIQGMRETLEMVIEHSKTMTGDEKLRGNAAALLETSSSARGSLARDAYDAKQWRDQVSDAREQMVGSRSVVLSTTPPPAEEKEADVLSSKIDSSDLAVIDEDTLPVANIPEAKPEENSVAEKRPERKTIPLNLESKPKETVADTSLDREERPAEKSPPVEKKPEPEDTKREASVTDRPVRIIGSAKRSENENSDQDQPNVKSSLDPKDVEEKAAPAEKGPLTIGSLIGYATRRVSPVYPRQARNLRMEGVVTLKVLVDEDGKVEEVSDLDGPAMLTQAAETAIKKWRFRPFTRDGEPVKASGFVSFNFNL
ncbi:MAG: energy transducer TonB [Acidobacteria bacterium]|nr:MAG: energy transducer TonB [Acidobacteriota bacterium]REK04021.1 MAG: energy transducer TonB [Acidobacteriota bacterium]REK15183.1 MAG: energy transducer TonB [Acidobacteriota bacterium]REK46273.1 MAG: energy transducer TonB [Acidobacteriota bacterium]